MRQVRLGHGRQRHPPPDRAGPVLQGVPPIAPEEYAQPIATFSGWIPQIKSGILIGNGAQVKFDTAEDAIPDLIKLIEHGRDRELLISVFAAKGR